MRRATALVLAATAIDDGRGYLTRYARATDAPDPGMVDAADLLDAAAHYLAAAGFSDAIKGAPAGDV